MYLFDCVYVLERERERQREIVEVYFFKLVFV